MAQPVIADLVIRNIGELLTMKGVDDPVVAPVAGDLGIIKRGEIAVKDRKILYVGPKDGGSLRRRSADDDYRRREQGRLPGVRGLAHPCHLCRHA